MKNTKSRRLQAMKPYRYKKEAEHTKEWDKFFKENPQPTKEQVIDYRDRVEDKVWHNKCDSPLE